MHIDLILKSRKLLKLNSTMHEKDKNKQNRVNVKSKNAHEIKQNMLEKSKENYKSKWF